MTPPAPAMTRLHVPIPFLMSPHDTRYSVTSVEMDVATLEPATAPVVATMRWNKHHEQTNGHHHDVKRCEFRLYEGRVLHRLNDLEKRDLHFEDSARSRDAWARATHRLEGFSAISNHPFTPKNLYVSYPGWVSAPLQEHEGFKKAMIRARAAASRAFIIDGEVWFPGAGPTYRTVRMHTRDRGYFTGIRPRHPAHETNAPYMMRQARYSPLALDQAKADFREVSGQEADFDETWKIEVLDPDAFRLDFFETSIEQAAWDLVWAVKKIPGRDLPRDGIAAILEFRDVLRSRWPDKALDFDPGFHDKNWPHKTFASPRAALKLELALAIEKVCDALELERRFKEPPFMRIAVARARSYYDYDPARIDEVAPDDAAALEMSAL